MSLASPILVSEKQTNDQAIFDNLLEEHHYSLEKQCVTLPLPTNYHTEEEEEDDDDDDDSCDDQRVATTVIGKIKPSTSCTRLDIAPPPPPRANSKVAKNTIFSSPAEIIVQPPAIQTYSPQLNLSLYSPSIQSSTISKGTAAGTTTTIPPPPTPLSTPSNSITMDIKSPPQPTPSTSRFRNAFQRLRGSSFSKNTSSIAPLDSSQMKMMPSKSSSLAEKIKNKLHHHYQLEKEKKKKTKKTEKTSMPRSASLSSITQWSRLNSNTHKKMVHSTSIASDMSLKPPSCLKNKEDPNALRAVNHPKPKKSIQFAKLVSVRDTYSKEEYNRCSDSDAICHRLTADMAQQIKEELNAFKLHEMPVHEYSRGNTHFFI